MATRSIDVIVIRRANAADSAALASLLAELGYPSTADAVERRIPQVTSIAAAFMAEVYESPAGFATVHLLNVIHHDRPMAILSALVVRESHRGQGCGRRLVKAAEAWARGEGAYRITVTSALARAEAHGFYERLGYEHTGRRYSRLL